MKTALLACNAAALLAAVTGPALGQPTVDFFKDKTITIITSTGSGGAYDHAARALTRHMPRFIPGAPTMVVRNMPGGGHTLATNFMMNQAPRDGTTIATVSNTIPLHQAVGGKGVRYDARRLIWLGSLGISNVITAAWAASGVRTIKDAMEREAVAGATGAGSGMWLYPHAMNQLLGTRFKIVMGYKSSVEVDLAMERGEVAVRSGASYFGYVQERPEWLRDKKLNILVQAGARPEKELPHVPMMHDLARTEEARALLNLMSSPVKVGRPYLAPPDVPEDRVALLRRAFDLTMQDAAFVAEARSLSLEVDPMSGAELQKVVDEAINAPPELLGKAKALMGE